MMIDLIGDIHGHADELETLLRKLGYQPSGAGFRHEQRKVLFIGDYIDRGPKIKRSLEIVKAMSDSGNAVALMGNHEYNAICFHTPKKEGGYLRPHLIKNIMQHYETLRQFQGQQEEYEGYIEWFKTLPLFYETDDFRAVHACWDHDNIAYLRERLPNAQLNNEALIRESADKSTRLYRVIEETLKGKEMKMPDGLFFHDKDGNKRSDIRIKWWDNPAESTYKTISVIPLENLPAEPIAGEIVQDSSFYGADEKNVFFGHYWLKGNPSLYRDNVCCLDYSVAKGGSLVAYCFDGEKRLSNRNFQSTHDAPPV